MHGMLETDQGYTLMGADTPPGMPYNPATTSRSASAATTATCCAGTGSSCRERER